MKTLLHTVAFLVCLSNLNTYGLSEDDKLFPIQESKSISPIDFVLPMSDTTPVEQASSNDIQITDNTTIVSAPTIAKNETKKMITCKTRQYSSEDAHRVEIVNSTKLLELLTPDNEITNKETEANCSVVMFYSRLCPFSAVAAPHFNALARSFPDIKLVALDALAYNGFNTQYGIVGVPTIIIFHNGRPVAKFNGTEYTIHSFVTFIASLTGLKEENNAVHSQDFQGPLPNTIDKDLDYYLVLAWVFIIVCCVFFFSKSFLWNIIIEKIKNTWREAEAQHAHID